MVWRAFSSTTLSVGIAFEIIIRFLHCACSVQYHRPSAICAESDSWKDIWLCHLIRRTLFLFAKSLHNIPLFFCYQCRVRIFYNNTFMIGANNRLFIFIGYFTQALVYQGLLLILVFEMTYVRKQNVKKWLQKILKRFMIGYEIFWKLEE